MKEKQDIGKNKKSKGAMSLKTVLIKDNAAKSYNAIVQVY